MPGLITTWAVALAVAAAVVFGSAATGSASWAQVVTRKLSWPSSLFGIAGFVAIVVTFMSNVIVKYGDTQIELQKARAVIDSQQKQLISLSNTVGRIPQALSAYSDSIGKLSNTLEQNVAQYDRVASVLSTLESKVSDVDRIGTIQVASYFGVSPPEKALKDIVYKKLFGESDLLEAYVPLTVDEIETIYKKWSIPCDIKSCQIPEPYIIMRRITEHAMVYSLLNSAKVNEALFKLKKN